MFHHHIPEGWAETMKARGAGRLILLRSVRLLTDHANHPSRHALALPYYIGQWPLAVLAYYEG